MIAVNRTDLFPAVKTPRVQNKITIFFNPQSQFHPIAAKISGLNTEDLRSEKDFDENAVKLLELFLRRLNPPICIIAQNGYKFDFPLLQAELLRVTCQSFEFLDCKENPIYCSDSLYLFKEFDDKLVPQITNESSSTDESLSGKSPHGSFSLPVVFQRVFGSIHTNAHNAEGDCIAVMKLVQVLGDPALSWFDSNYRKLSDIKTMYTIDETDPSPLPPDQFPIDLDQSSWDN
nr:three prime repair exonuclease 1 [Hymenolepis microstoma]